MAVWKGYMSEKKNSQLTVEEWHDRVARSDALSALGMACALCGGTGGWPGLQELVVCKPCGGSGSAIDVGERHPRTT